MRRLASCNSYAIFCLFSKIRIQLRLLGKDGWIQICVCPLCSTVPAVRKCIRQFSLFNLEVVSCALSFHFCHCLVVKVPKCFRYTHPRCKSAYATGASFLCVGSSQFRWNHFIHMFEEPPCLNIVCCSPLTGLLTSLMIALSGLKV